VEHNLVHKKLQFHVMEMNDEETPDEIRQNLVRAHQR